jgi:hypothetical protein
MLETGWIWAMKNTVLSISITVLALSWALSVAAAATPKVGVAAAVKNNVQRVSGGNAQPLAVGNEVFNSERIRTGDDSAAQILLLDKTTLTVGPRAELTLDNFVYNPSHKTGRVVLNAVQGAFRFITGSQAPQSYTIRTPVGSLGVRGTIVDLFVDKNTGQVIIALGQGAIGFTFTYNGQTYTLNKANTAYIFSADGTVQGPGFIDFFGTNFVGGPIDSGLLSFYLNNMDQLNAITQHGLTPPVLPSGGGGGYGNGG